MFVCKINRIELEKRILLYPALILLFLSPSKDTAPFYKKMSFKVIQDF